MAVIVHGCCCMSLRTAGLVFSWLGVGQSVFGFIVNMFKLALDEEEKTISDGLLFFLIMIIILALALLFNGLNIRGITKNNHYYLLPTLILHSIAVIIFIICGFVSIFGFINVSSYTLVILPAVTYLILLGLVCWYWIVFYSLYEEIRLSKINPLSEQLLPESRLMQNATPTSL